MSALEDDLATEQGSPPSTTTTVTASPTESESMLDLELAAARPPDFQRMQYQFALHGLTCSACQGAVEEAVTTFLMDDTINEHSTKLTMILLQYKSLFFPKQLSESNYREKCRQTKSLRRFKILGSTPS
jgi:hypothetical protein